MAKPSSSAMVDALPYVDQGYDEAARSAALTLIEEECKKYRPTKNYLAHLPSAKYDSFETAVMKTEFERIHNRQPMEMLSMKRYELPGPAAGKLTDVGAWQEAVSNSQAQLEHQATRLMNLELMTEYGAETWKSYNDTLQKMLVQAHKELTNLRRQIQEIHYDRKRKQTETGERLRNLEASWVGLVGKNYEIEKACADLESMLEPLRKKYKADSGGNGRTSESLREAEVEIIPTSICNDRSHYNGRIKSTMFCAGEQPGKDSCQGDSNGPLTCNNELIGIVTWGAGCANATKPGVYTNVAAMKGWIEEEMKWS